MGRAEPLPIDADVASQAVIDMRRERADAIVGEFRKLKIDTEEG